MPEIVCLAQNNNSIWKALTIAFDIAFILGGSILLGFFLDSWIHTTPLFILLFILLGVFVAFYKIIKIGAKK